MRSIQKVLSALTLVTLLALAFVPPAYAFDGRGGEKVVISSGEVIDDDLYVSAQDFTLDGTVNGDVVSVGRTSTINGTINGDLMAAGQTVVVNGTVKGTIRVAGSVLLVGEKASIEGDIIGAGYSLEVKKGSSTGRDLVFAGGQILLAGDVTRNVQVATAAFELDGTVGGDVRAEVGEPGQNGPPPTVFMPPSPVSTPTVKQGLTLAPSAKVAGNLEYTQSKELAFPAGVVAGKITHRQPVANQNAPRPETAGEKISRWGLNLLRTTITLILVGLLLLWLFPFFIQGLGGKLQSAPWSSLGWGVIACAAVIFVGMLIIALTLLLGIVLAISTLGRLAGAVFGLGGLSLVALLLGFWLVVLFIAKIAFGQALGKWLLARTSPSLAEHRYWPMILGVIITVVVIALLSFPLIPGVLGWLLNLAVTLFGLGALWLWGRERTAVRSIRPVG